MCIRDSDFPIVSDRNHCLLSFRVNYLNHAPGTSGHHLGDYIIFFVYRDCGLGRLGVGGSDDDYRREDG